MHFLLVSRDERTKNNFRNSWDVALGGYGLVNHLTRGQGVRNCLVAIAKLCLSKASIKIVFGTTEILIFSLFLKKNDVYVFTGLGRLFLKKSFFKKVILFWMRGLYRGQLIIVLNQHDKRVIKKVYGGISNIYVIPGEGYSFNNESKKIKEGVTKPPYKFCYAGRLLKSKGVDRLIKEFRSNSQFELHLFGDDDFANKDSINVSKEEKLSLQQEGIFFHGYCDDVILKMRYMDFYISLSQREGMPFSVCDAISAGCVIFLSKVPGHLSFKHLDGVYYVEKENLSMNLYEILQDPEKLICFNRDIRLKAAINIFGINSVIEMIKRIIVNNKKAV
jgi:glycosyltransferase involved in cell wall biosynthesis